MTALPAIKYEVVYQAYGTNCIELWEHTSKRVLSWDYDWLQLCQSWWKS